MTHGTVNHIVTREWVLKYIAIYPFRLFGENKSNRLCTYNKFHRSLSFMFFFFIIIHGGTVLIENAFLHGKYIVIRHV